MEGDQSSNQSYQKLSHAMTPALGREGAKRGSLFIFISIFTLFAIMVSIYWVWSKTNMHSPAVPIEPERGKNEAASSGLDGRIIRSPVSSSARPVRASWQWRERVRAVVQKTSATSGYRVYKALYDKEDYPDPDATTIFLFKAATSPGSAPHGLLVLKPEDYVDLSMLPETELEAEIDQRLFSHWATVHGRDNDSLEAFGNHILDVASVLYAQPRMEQEFRVNVKLSHGEVPITVECGVLQLAFDSITVDQLLELPAIERDLHIAEMIEQLDPEISRYLR